MLEREGAEEGEQIIIIMYVGVVDECIERQEKGRKVERKKTS